MRRNEGPQASSSGADVAGDPCSEVDPMYIKRLGGMNQVRVAIMMEGVAIMIECIFSV